MGVRFIAITDGYDSNDHIGTTGGIEIAFKSLLYDMYSKDLSEKMRSSLLVRRKRGDFIGPRAPFGYQFSENKKSWRWMKWRRSMSRGFSVWPAKEMEPEK